MKLITLVSLLSLATSEAVVLHVDSPNQVSPLTNVGAPETDQVGTPITVAEFLNQPTADPTQSSIPTTDRAWTLPSSFNTDESMSHGIEWPATKRTAKSIKAVAPTDTLSHLPTGASTDDGFTNRILLHMGVSGSLILLTLGIVGYVDWSRRRTSRPPIEASPPQD